MIAPIDAGSRRSDFQLVIGTHALAVVGRWRAYNGVGSKVFGDESIPRHSQWSLGYSHGRLLDVSAFPRPPFSDFAAMCGFGRECKRTQIAASAFPVT